MAAKLHQLQSCFVANEDLQRRNVVQVLFVIAT